MPVNEKRNVFCLWACVCPFVDVFFLYIHAHMLCTCVQSVICVKKITCFALSVHMRRLKGATLKGAAGERECFCLCVRVGEKERSTAIQAQCVSTRFPINEPLRNSHSQAQTHLKSLKGAPSDVQSHYSIPFYHSLFPVLCARL